MKEIGLVRVSLLLTRHFRPRLRLENRPSRARLCLRRLTQHLSDRYPTRDCLAQ
jgi:hypothetical protein